MKLNGINLALDTCFLLAIALLTVDHVAIAQLPSCDSKCRERWPFNVNLGEGGGGDVSCRYYYINTCLYCETNLPLSGSCQVRNTDSATDKGCEKDTTMDQYV